MSVARPTRGRGAALARTALAGNPSDGFGGAVLATTFTGYRAEAQAQFGAHAALEPPSELVALARGRFAREIEPAAERVALTWSQSIPREVGLGSSSALAIAVLRALDDLLETRLTPAQLASLAHAIEREDLGVPGGRQDQGR